LLGRRRIRNVRLHVRHQLVGGQAVLFHSCAPLVANLIIPLCILCRVRAVLGAIVSRWISWGVIRAA
jgi:hypothetical protein